MVTASAMTTNSARPLFLAILCSVSVTACAGSSDQYPSLAVRDIERQSGVFTPSQNPAQPIDPVASTTEISAIVRRAEQSDAAFRDAEPGVRQLARDAARLGTDSNAYSQTLVAIADLTSLRTQAAIALGDLDALEASAAVSFAPLEDLKAAQESVSAIIDRQNAQIDSLLREIGQ